jgi:hypothetical protein
MKKLFFAISAATLLVAGPAAFANYAGWRDATFGTPGALEATRIVGARGDAAAIVVAQYNPCPNGRCK